MKTIYTLIEASVILGITPSQVRQLMDSGKIRGYRFNSERRIPKEYLDRYIANKGENAVDRSH